MKRLISMWLLIMLPVIAVLLFISHVSFAGPGDLCEDSRNRVIQGYCPNGLYSALLTTASTPLDMRLYRAFSTYCAGDATIRLSASSSKSGTISEPITGGQWSPALVVNQATPFAIISGCAGNLRRQ